ncbi:SDR family NAD(P)-dependent oxidoreductase [Paractinoplanes hotanensis]|uniref:SDR family NAD(P)-dependent oxidoreductase n=1 Tax=Paractinoplanes hotanensis TaxID=2906497 RepID=A0ABT0YCZ1_9ACTN|nr:SDR family NAD(P)-dependent oxidoreductase [Actinoplanes hotanensis]MCM4083615.1 SDR family NAD(P)-dependent oxidoreductase [Actinoplanes hotanensis]
MSTWLVTGTSRGLGLEIVKQLLERGDNVAATTRSAHRLTEALGATPRDRLLPLELDLTDESAVDVAVCAAEDRFGGIDVVVNNAGYGFLGAVEETTAAEVQRMFQVQVFGVWNMLRAVLPGMRTAGRGHIINVSSVLGLTAFPGWALYCSAKYALEGLSDALAGEVAGFGIKVNVVEPGYTRTDFLRPPALSLPEHHVEGYDAIRTMTDAHLAMGGTQLGDPVKVATAIIEVGDSGKAPLHQLLGSDSYRLGQDRVRALAQDFEAGRKTAVSTDTTPA